MAQRKQKILLLGFENMGIGSSSLLAAEALSRNPALDVRFLYDRSVTESTLLRTRLKQIRGLAVRTRSRRHLPLTYLQILFYCLRFRPDVVHDLGGSAYRKNLPLWPALSLLSRLVFTEYAPEKNPLRSLPNRLARRLAYRLGRKFVVFGPESHAALLASGVDRRKVFQSRLGHKGFYASTPRAHPPRDPNLILFFGDLRPSKGVTWLLPIADAVHARWPQARFVVAGSSAAAPHFGADWVRQLHTCLAAMRTRPYFQVRDEFIPEEDVAGCFRHAGMVLLPYREANQSGVLLTAMALECPVVSSRVGDIPSVLRHDENGILSPSDPAALAAGLLTLLQDPQRAATLAAQARRDAHEHYAWEHLVREYPHNVYAA